MADNVADETSDDSNEGTGRRVVVSLDSGDVTGRVRFENYVLREGTPVVAVVLDEPTPDGRSQLVVEAERIRSL